MNNNIPSEYCLNKIIHIDMDAFFASVEQLDNPQWRGRPVIVAGPAERRGVVSTCSYEARAFGVHSAMPTIRAQRLCPKGIFVEGNMRRYKEISDIVHGIFHEYTDLVEKLSIDEAYLDVTENYRKMRSATRLAQDIQRTIFERTGLTASAGVSYNKFLAKVASGMRKPAGLTVIEPEKAWDFLGNLPIEKFYGIGRVTAGKLQKMNIRSGRELRMLDISMLTAHFGKNGGYYYRIVRGIDDRAVEVADERKSVGKENTYPVDLTDHRQMRMHVRALGSKVGRILQHRHLAGRTVTVKVRFADFRTLTRSQTLHGTVSRSDEIGETAVFLLGKALDGKECAVRLLGVSVSNFPTAEELDQPIQLEFDFGKSIMSEIL